MSFFASRSRHLGLHPGEDLQNGPSALRLDGVRKNALETSRTRLVVTAAVFLAAFSIIGLRMIDVTVLDSNPAKPRPLPQARTEGLEMDRADIVDRNGVILATSLPTVSLYAKPTEILDPAEAAAKLVTVLPELNKNDVQMRLSGGKQFIWLRRNLTPRQQYDVNALGIPGLYFERGERRVYPHGSLVAHVVGMADIDNKGIAGIEKSFESELHEEHEPVRLSVDIRLQTLVHNELIRAMEVYRASGATGMIMDVRTGELLSMVSLPDYDPNDPPAGASDALFNRATKGAYEMGSTFKLFNTAMALESGKVNINSSFDATRPLKFAGFEIHDDHAQNKWLSVTEIMIHSSNIGSARMAMEVGTDYQKAFMGRMGMLTPPPLELPEIGAPQIPNPWREINTITISFGHGLSVTPVQMISGVAALVNGGTYHAPTLVARDPAQPPAGPQVVSAKTSDAMRQLMRVVVTEGTGKKSDVPGYDVGGKTGTAEKAAGGGYKKKSVLASFIATFPMDSPRYVVVVMLDEPQGTKETYGFIAAGWNSAPVAGRIIAQMAPMVGLTPKPAAAPASAGKGIAALPPAKGGRDVPPAR